MKQPAPLAFWKQSKFNSCGPAVMMTALHELGMPGLSEKREMEIWKQVKHPFGLGSLPARMAVYAASQGVKVKFLHKNISPDHFKIYWKTPRKTLHKQLIRTYYETAKEAENNGLPTEHYQDEQEILDRLMETPGLRVIYLIIDDDGVLHFVLAREKDGRIVVMDPYYGRNNVFDLPDFQNRRFPAMVGYAILLSA
ncbi:peptidase C39 family protein [Desulfatibacillum aliphaticivorans]|uniref:peptidase C39 family protein n=1 Tax=Desulfatibacillum aliphaticivorans TaxID=218208 RepID=UPI00041F8301|nr:peptidase C39 family protein [Desulfatibacillum aliphaticivorans]